MIYHGKFPKPGIVQREPTPVEPSTRYVNSLARIAVFGASDGVKRRAENKLIAAIGPQRAAQALLQFTRPYTLNH